MAAMHARLRSLAWVLLFGVALGLMWYQTFEVTGVKADVVPAGAERPAPAPPPELANLPTDQADIDLFASAHPVWSALSY